MSRRGGADGRSADVHSCDSFLESGGARDHRLSRDLHGASTIAFYVDFQHA